MKQSVKILVTYVLQDSVFSCLFPQHNLQRHIFLQRGLGHLRVVQNRTKNEQIPLKSRLGKTQSSILFQLLMCLEIK